ncbi:MAG: hypothetical protein A2X36_05465 [Elusimicrobia bacterium GWA2_69_24]|nr:MAG: hypothetical protein A2X36_05465 [Elusimicrobia bacterium GWA2_69_24]HBL16006.1 hypothetical protein [Elusimicrobiota bacterium]
MPPRKCPGCDLEIEPSAERCPYCYRDLKEDAPVAEMENVKPPPKDWRKIVNYFLIAAVLLLLGLVLPKLTDKAKGLMAFGEKEARFQQPAAPEVTAPPVPPAPPQNKKVQFRILGPSDSVPKWFLEGQVFELRTTGPVGEGQVLFKDPNAGEDFGAELDAKGRYRAWLPVNTGGYFVSIVLPTGTGTLMEDFIPSLRKLGQDQRMSMAQSALSDASGAHVMAAEGAKERRDFALARPEDANR